MSGRLNKCLPRGKIASPESGLVRFHDWNTENGRRTLVGLRQDLHFVGPCRKSQHASSHVLTHNLLGLLVCAPALPVWDARLQ